MAKTSFIDYLSSKRIPNSDPIELYSARLLVEFISYLSEHKKKHFTVSTLADAIEELNMPYSLDDIIKETEAVIEVVQQDTNLLVSGFKTNFLPQYPVPSKEELPLIRRWLSKYVKVDHSNMHFEKGYNIFYGFSTHNSKIATCRWHSQLYNDRDADKFYIILTGKINLPAYIQKRNLFKYENNLTELVAYAKQKETIIIQVQLNQIEKLKRNLEKLM